MIFITGDTHGDWMSRLCMEAFPEQKNLTKNDYVIIAGDFGYWHDTKSERYNLDWLNSRSFTTLFVSGNHENYDRLKQLPIEKWNGGKIQKIRSSIYHLMRGQIFEIDNHKFFTFGGASSHDIKDGILDPDDVLFEEKCKILNYSPFSQYRINHVSWWKEELPSEEEMKEGIDNLKKHNNKVDFIITHSPCTSLLAQMNKGYNLYKPDYLTDYLQDIKQTVDYKRWIFGHMHINQAFESEKSICIFEQIIRLV